MKEKLAALWEVVADKIKPVVHMLNLCEDGSHSFFKGGRMYSGRLCTCGKIKRKRLIGGS